MQNFSLGDGIDTITGEKKNNGTEIFSNIPAATIEQIYNYPEYEIGVDIINNNNDLDKFLNIQPPFIDSNPSALDSIKLQIAHSTKLDKINTILVVKFRKIYREEKLNLTTITPHNDEDLPDDFSDLTVNDFYRTYGDEFITQINYGREFYAVIEYSNIKKEKLFDIKQYLIFFLNQIRGSQFIASEELIHKKNIVEQHQNCKVDIKYSGSCHDIPNFVTSLNDLIVIIRKFDKDVSQNHVALDYKNISYTAVTRLLHNASNVYQQIASNIIVAKKYLNIFNDDISKIDSLINKLEHFNIENPQAITNLEIVTLRNKLETEKSNIQSYINDVKQSIPNIHGKDVKGQNYEDKFDNIISNIAIIISELELVTSQLNTAKKDIFITSGNQRNKYSLSTVWMEKTSRGTHLNLGISGNINLFWHVIEHTISTDNLSGNNINEITYKVYRKKKCGSYHDLGINFKESGTFIAINDYSDEDKYCIANPEKNNGKNFTVAVRKV